MCGIPYNEKNMAPFTGFNEHNVTENILKITKGQSESVKWRRTDNTMVKWKRTKRQKQPTKHYT